MSDLANSLYGPKEDAPAPAVSWLQAARGSAPPLAPSAPVQPPPPAASASSAPPASPAVLQSQAGSSAEAPAGAPALSVDAIASAVPDEIRQARSETTRRLYGGDAELVKAMPDEMFKTEGVTSEVQAALAAEMRAMAGDIGFTPADVVAVREALAAARETPINDEQRVSNREQIVEALNKQYGQGARQAWLDARAFVARDPRRAAMLAPVGDDPRTVLRIVQLAQKARAAGKMR